MRIGVAIHFCTDDAAFLPAIVRECRKFTDEIVVSYYDHFFDGEPEDLEWVRMLKNAYPDVRWVEIPFPGKAKDRDAMHMLHGRNRWEALRSMPDSVTHALLIDSDEIPDGDAFAKFRPHHLVYRFCDFLYWRRPTLCAKTRDGTAVLVPRALWKEKIIVNGNDRGAAKALSVTGEPMIHHFSWARPLAQIERKIARWPNKEPELLAKLREEWSRPFSGRDCLRRSETRSYVEVPNRFDLPCGTT